MRARPPDREGFVDRDGVRIFFEVYENHKPTILLVPTTTIFHSRQWKGQVHYLARHFRVVSYDGRGNGRSSVPGTVDAYRDEELRADLLAVMDATGTSTAIHLAYCHAVPWTIHTAVHHPGRVKALIAVAPGVEHLAPPMDHYVRAAERFEEEIDQPVGWEMLNRRFYLANYETYTKFFFSEMHPEAHSTKLWEDSVSWSLDRTPQTALLERQARRESALEPSDLLGLVQEVTQSILVIHGELDHCQRVERAYRLAELTNGELEIFKGVGHAPQSREPVRFNLLVKQFAERMSA